MTIVISLLLMLSISTIAGLVLLVNSVYRKPDSEWFNESKSSKKWRSINLLSFIISVVFGTLTQFTMQDFFPTDFKIISGVFSTLLTYISVQSLFTDFYDRRVDRKGLRIACLISLFLGFYLIVQNDPIYIFLYVFYLILAISTLFFISPSTKEPFIGQSDSRAIILVVLSAFPVLGISYFNMAAFGVVLLVLLYGVFLSFKLKDFNIFFKNKVSMPMVPFILIPYAVFVSFSHLLELL